MQAVVFYLILPFLYLVSLLPLSALYVLSDILYFLVYKFVGYRKYVVRLNLSNAFPALSQNQLKQLEAKTYRYFCDLLIESIKNITISESELRKRLKFESLEVFEKYSKHNQSIIVMMGHFGNWELAGSRIALEKLHKTYVVYKPQKNKLVDGLVKKARTRFGNEVYAMKHVARGMFSNRNNLTSTVFISDQNPTFSQPRELEFLNQQTYVFDGAERLAKKMHYPVIYAEVRRFKRGYYTISLSEICQPNQLESEDITSTFFKNLERSIQATPETWIWTHKRWKRTNNGAYKRTK